MPQISPMNWILLTVLLAFTLLLIKETFPPFFSKILSASQQKKTQKKLKW